MHDYTSLQLLFINILGWPRFRTGGAIPKIGAYSENEICNTDS